MHRILAFSTDDEFLTRLEAAASERGDLDLQIASDVDAAGELGETKGVDLWLIDETIAALPPEKAQRLVEIVREEPVAAVGEADLASVEPALRVEAEASASALLSECVEAIEHLNGAAVQPEWEASSGKYFVAETQNAGLVTSTEGASGEGPRSTVDEVEAGTSPRRILYVGEPDELREHIEAAADEFELDLVFADAPRSVDLRAGDVHFDRVVIARPDHLADIHQLIRFLRRRQPQPGFEVTLIIERDSATSPGLARSLGADHALREPVDVAGLLESLASPTATASRTDMLVVAESSELEFYEQLLGPEAVDMIFASNLEEARDAFEMWPPELVLVDATHLDIALDACIDTFRRAHPFAPARYLGVVDSDADIGVRVRRVCDDLIGKSDSIDAFRRSVRLQLAQLELGRLAHERDSLTGAKKALLLGDELQRRLSRARDADQVVVLTAFDVDDLGAINERYGRPLGNSVLRALWDTLHVTVEGRDVVYRTDADEFFVLQSADASAWREMTDSFDRALQVFRQQTFRAADGRGTYATASGGAVVIPPVDVDAEVCLQKAWIVLERAIAGRRDRLLVAQIDPSALPARTSERELSEKS